MSLHQRILVLASAVCLALALSWGSFTSSLEAQGGTPITVDVAANRRAIDPRVYGVNWADAAQLAALNVPIHRWGGNSTTRHNWKTNGDNKGSDWYFESIPGSGAQGAAFDAFVQDSLQNFSQPMVTIPLIGWVGKNGPGGSKLASFSAAKYGAQQSCDWQWYPDACNGVRTSGQNVTGNDPNDASLAVNPQYMKEWAQHLVSRWGTAASGGVKYYVYDNEPSLWHHTHRDVHPAGQTMAEFRDLMIAYGTAIKQADAGAVFVGPEEWGWLGYLMSGYDQKYANDTGCWSCAPDRTANGGLENAPWLLSQMRQHELSTGNRLLHVFTLHYYPQGGEFSDDTSSSMQALRNRSTRSLWDPNYTDETWIAERIRLIPRMKDWVNTHYPGLETGITEYNWGAEGHINGATAQADVLGIFGREGLNVGTRWTTPSTSSPSFKAIQMYRNYDGARSVFGDTSVRATVANPDNVSAFAAERTSDGAVTVMAINKVTTSSLVNLSLANFTAGTTAQVWRLSSTNTIQRLTDVTVTGGTINTTLPAQSITLFVVPRSGSSTPSLSIGDVSLNEGQSGSSNAVFTVSLSASASANVTVNYATSNGTATAGSDYTAASSTLTFTPGQTSKTLSVPVAGDTVIEADETFNVTLSGPTNATIADAVGAGTIRNDDFPSMSIGDVTVTEGNSGNTTASFSVTLSAASLSNVTVNYATANGTAVAPGDYAALSGNLTFTPGQTSKTIAVSVVGETTVEANETFVVNLTGAAGATIADAQGVGTITNDDVAPPSGAVPVVWTSGSGVTIAGSSLTKTASTAWGNAGAVSTQQITAGDGYVELTASETTTYRMIGLSNGNSGTSYVDIDFALYLHLGELRVYEAGVAKGTFGNFSAGDTLRVAMVGGVGKYSKNGVVLYSSARTPVYPLLVDTALYSVGATLNNAVIAVGTAPPPPPPPPPPSGSTPVVWTSVTGATAASNSVTKTAATAWGNAGAVSTQQIASGDGYVELTASETTTYRMIGLSNGNSNASYDDIDFALYLHLGELRVYEAGVYKGTFGTFSTGNTLRVAIVGGVGKYSKNGVVFYSSVRTPVYPLLVDTALYSVGATLNSAVIGGASTPPPPPPPAGSQPVVWSSVVGATPAGNSLSKTATTAWGNAGAVSSQQIASGDGYVEVTASETTTYRMVGLSNGNSNASYEDIDFALYLHLGELRVYEAGVYKGTFGAFSAGNALRVAVVGGVVRYSKNGVVFYSSSRTPAYPLLVDTAAYSQSATLNNAMISGAP